MRSEEGSKQRFAEAKRWRNCETTVAFRKTATLAILAALVVVRYSFLGDFSCPHPLLAISATKRKKPALVKSIAPSAKASTTCVFAPTVYTIARSAGKLAMFP
jgi:hypothetical protein